MSSPDTAVAQSPGPDPVIQFSLHADNKVGRLNEVVGMLRTEGVHVLALTSIDATDSAIVRLVTNYPDDTRRIFRERSLPFSEAHVVVAEIASENELMRVTRALVEAEINIHYVFSFLARPNGKSALGLRLEDNDIAVETLQNQGVKVLSQRDLAR